MKTYSVKEIADTLKTDPETVRRWIRTGKLKAIKESRKSGNIITEDMLRIFLQNFPKYASSAAPLLASPVGIGVTVATLLGGILAGQHIKSERLKRAKVDTGEIVNLLEIDIATRKSGIEKKIQTLSQLQQEIDEETKLVEAAEQLITELTQAGTEQEGK